MSEKIIFSSQKKKMIVEQMWLHYYNNTLFQKGVITETERNRMKNLINSRKDTMI